MPIKVAIISEDPSKYWFARATNIVTGCTAEHIGFLDTDTNLFYSQRALFERENFAGLYQPKQVQLFDPPVAITARDLEVEILDHNSVYGVSNLLLWPFRWVFRAMNRKVPDFRQPVCSQRVEMVFERKGWKSPFVSPPSPCDWLLFFRARAS